MSEEKDSIEKNKRSSAKEDRGSEKTESTGESKTEDLEKQAAKDAFEAAEKTQESQLPILNFATFIFSLNSSALVHLGMLEDPGIQKKVQNLSLAKQTIDILGMLEEKTRGNLMDDEEKMLKNMLYDLRILYIKEKG